MSKQVKLNLDWRFHEGDEPGADFMGYDDSAWREVTLPHDWSVEHPFDRGNASGTGYLPGGMAWYRKRFVLPADAAGKRVRLTFGGVYKHARVWINSNYLGTRAYGYSSFTFDVSAFVRPGENVLCVRVEHDEVADSRWFTGSGIYRDVLLEISEPCAFETDGIFVTTEAVTDGRAVVGVAYETIGGDGAAFDVVDAAGETVAQGEAAGEKGKALITVENPALWSPDSPALYTLRAHVRQGGDVTDEKCVRFGIRTIRFDGDTGFYLNGIQMKIKGVCVHHDGGALGAAVPQAVWVRRIRKFKEAGTNALRTAHNPPDPLLLDLCDEMGLLVMDEAFDEWEGAKNKWWQGHNVYPPKRFGYAEDFPMWHKADLEGMILRDRNHPSVILWSIGNEIDYPNDPYVTPLFTEVLGNNDANKPAAERMYDVRKPDAGRLAVVARELTEIVHALDTTRPVTSALSFPELSNRTGYADVLDAAGYNYKEQFYEEDHARYPGRVIYGSENSHHPNAWRAVVDHDYICGQFLWTGVDFLGECQGWPVRISQAGMLTLAGYEKPLFYQRKAMWCDEPFVRIACRDAAEIPEDHRQWIEETPWNEAFVWNGAAGDQKVVSCYTNAAQVELFLNGRSLGVKEAGNANAWRAQWTIPYEAGVLKAVVAGAEDTLETAGAAAKIDLTADRASLCADGQSIAQVEVTLCDAQGRVTAQDERVMYQITGDAQIIGIENGCPDDLTPYAEKYRRTRGGRAIVYVRAGRLAGDITLHAYTASGLKARCVLTQE